MLAARLPWHGEASRNRGAARVGTSRCVTRFPGTMMWIARTSMPDTSRTLPRLPMHEAAVESVAAGWGGYPCLPQRRATLWWTGDALPWASPGGVLPRGLGRSYGDSGLTHGGTIVDTTPCRRLLEFDTTAGLLTAEAGASLGSIAAATLPHGWYPPVMPGTRHVTLGGAIANDIHGKNHWSAGSFGCHVRSLDLRRSDRDEPVRLFPGDPLFAATVGGLGLTGMIVGATVALVRVPGPGIASTARSFASWDDYFAQALEVTQAHAHSVEWFAPSARGAVRGTFRLGDPADGPARWNVEPAAWASVPFDFPAAALSRPAIATFNAMYLYAGRRAARRTRLVPVWPYMHPLDGCATVNRIYGRRGFLQYHFVVPRGADRTEVPRILATIADEGLRVFLPVMKQFGPVPSPGLLSFPLPGTSVALDFPWQGDRLLRVLDDLDARVADCGGRVYVAKDARMSGRAFRAFYPRWEELERHRDPTILSQFWHRVMHRGASP